MSKKARRADVVNPVEQRQQAPGPRPRPRQRRTRRSALLQVGVGVVAIAILVGSFVYYSLGHSSGGVAIAASADLGTMTADTPTSPTGNFTPVSAPLRSGQKPVLLFVGAQWCPYCAAERWSIVKALARFGSWSGLTIGQSTDRKGGFGVVPTYGLTTATFSSPYVAYEGKELQDNSSATLQSLTASEQALVDRYDSKGSLPMVYVDGYAMVGAGYTPTGIQGQAFSAIQSQLQRGSSAASIEPINAEANLLTAMLCKADGDRPGTACSNATIQAIEQGLQ